MDKVMATITDLPRLLHRTQAMTQLLETQMPVFQGQQETYNKLEHLLSNHIRSFKNKLTEDEKLQVFLDFLRDDALEFWQTLHINPEMTLQDVLTKFRKVYAREDFKEVSRYEAVYLKFDPKAETFNGFLEKLKHIGKQAFGLKANEYVSEFPFYIVHPNPTGT